MNRSKKERISQLPNIAVMTTKELKQRGFTNQDLTRAGKEGLLTNCGYGVWARNVPLYLYQELKVFQKGSQSCHIGGRTILYLLLGAPAPEQIQLFDHRETRKYPNSLEVSRQVQTIPCRIFRDEYSFNECCGIIERDGLYWSTPARALFESIHMISNLDDCRSIIRAMERLEEIDMDDLIQVIECCHSEKAKRWFFYLASKVSQDWAWVCTQDSVVQKVLSKSTYSLQTPGSYVSNFRITVPEELEREFPRYIPAWFQA